MTISDRNTNQQNTMGDQANIVIEKDDHCFTAPVFFYTRWNGYERKETLRNALERGRDRWYDPKYLARIIFCEMVEVSVSDLTGFGITTVMCDNSYPLLCVNIEEQKIREREPSKNADGQVFAEWTFEEFVSLHATKEKSEE